MDGRILIAIAALPLLVAVPACSSSDGAAAGVTVTETPVDGEESDAVAGVTAWEDGFVAVTDGGAVLTSPDGERWKQVRATGAGGPSFVGVAATEESLLLAGNDSVETGEDRPELTPQVWRSNDGERWKQLETSGLTAESLDVVVADRDGFVVFGNEEVPPPPDYEPTDAEAEDGELPATISVISTWRSDDGEAWEKLGGHVLPPGENSLEAVRAAALDGDQWLASLGVECNGCYDDFAFVLAASDDGGDTWTELDPEGLDDIKLANTDVIPRIVSTGSGFVAAGTSGEEDTQATVWQSDDGRTWTGKKRLGGPEIEDYAESIDALLATDAGVIALEIAGGALIAWKVEL